MPQTLFTQDGDEKEVPTDEELEALKKPSEMLGEVMKELGIDPKDDITTQLDEIKVMIKDLKDSEHPNWAETRQKIKSLENLNRQLQAEGKHLDENGKIVEKKDVSIDDIRNESAKAARMELLNEKVSDSIAVYTEDDQKVIMHYFTKLTNGEELTLRNVDKFLSDAINASGINKVETDPVKKAYSGIKGTGGEGSGNKNFADTATGKDLLKSMGIESPDNK